MNNEDQSKTRQTFNSLLEAANNLPEGCKIKGSYRATAYGPDGNIKWTEEWNNLVVNAGLNHILSIVLAAGTQITAWYLGLTAASPTPAAADTMASHAGWTENVTYSESTRQAFTPGAVASQSVDNSGSLATFTINGSTTVGGAFLTSVSTKSGSTGTLFAAGAFSTGNRALLSGDTLKVQATYGQADDGV